MGGATKSGPCIFVAKKGTMLGTWPCEPHSFAVLTGWHSNSWRTLHHSLHLSAGGFRNDAQVRHGGHDRMPQPKQGCYSAPVVPLIRSFNLLFDNARQVNFALVAEKHCEHSLVIALRARSTGQLVFTLMLGGESR